MAQAPPPRVFSPVQSSPSPGNAGAFLPPTKRQRLSPNPSSPYAMSPNSPSFSNVALPTANIGSPVNGTPTMPPPPPATNTGAMGPPPSRPAADKATDLNELGDVIASSGIDIRDEEAAMYQSYLSNDKPSAASFGSQGATSFNSTTSAGSAPGGYPLSTTTNEGYSVSLPIQAGPSAFYGTGPLSQPAAPTKTPEELAAEKWRLKARAINEKRQQHLSAPFLYTNTVRHKIGRRAFENGVRVPMEGLYDPIPEKIPANRPVNSQSVVGSDGTTVSVVKGPSLIDETAPLADILALISLATNERIRNLVEDAAALAKGRRVGSHGIVPPEWSDLAVGPGAESTGAQPSGSAGASSTTATGNRQGWESAVSPRSMPMKRPSISAASKPPDGSPKPTLSFPNELARTLRNMSQKERQQEEARLARRAKKASEVAASGGGDASKGGASSVPATPGAGAPSGGGLIGERAPEVKMTKKEREKLAKAGESEASQHAAANVMANISLGGAGGGGLFGKKKGAYSWMTKDKPSASSSAFPSKLNTSFGPGSGGSSADATAAYLGPGGRRFGEWREDREKGQGIQMRDLIGVLEADGMEKKSLAWAYTRLNARD
ncbi:hypothetical protein L228DRAFT_266341 [Xylona heveae TC161]|uniref:Transcription initiation factor TFIID subunit 4 n=1 Tax=Xylona heveae (strain CBS 132557 / TC161) TaxID=1328760 RepID=A0A161TDL7_XYLHT|nr:hypothetical protein L228DRAFT_266341 [Xylona heveae TC161]KZF23967.1 hypothetical protein L228DRAFT_266341 [Xylona heveae TC161]